MILDFPMLNSCRPVCRYGSHLLGNPQRMLDGFHILTLTRRVLMDPIKLHQFHNFTYYQKLFSLLCNFRRAPILWWHFRTSVYPPKFSLCIGMCVRMNQSNIIYSSVCNKFFCHLCKSPTCTGFYEPSIVLKRSQVFRSLSNFKTIPFNIITTVLGSNFLIIMAQKRWFNPDQIMPQDPKSVITLTLHTTEVGGKPFFFYHFWIYFLSRTGSRPF